MRNAVCMTVYNRPQLALINTFVKLGSAGNGLWKDTEIIVMDDGSTLPYEPLLEQFKDLPVRWLKCDTVADRPGSYNINGYNNPAYASNQLIDAVDAENVFWMTSDTMVSPAVMHEALKLDLSKVVWMPCIIDLDTNKPYLSPDRIAPFGWFMATTAENFRKVRWDEEYLKGIAFEDNDFMALLGLEVGRFVIDKAVVCWHQSHPSIAYSDELKGWKINDKYIREKWAGVPWHTEHKCPLKLALTHVNQQMVLDVAMQEGREVKVA